MAPRGVTAANNPISPSVDAWRCVPPTIVGESGNGSVWCGDGRHPPPHKHGRLPVRAPLTIASESRNGSVQCGCDLRPLHLGMDARRLVSSTIAGWQRDKNSV